MFQAASTWIDETFRVLELTAVTILIVALFITYPSSLCGTPRADADTANTTHQLDLDNFL
jgi:hypothetical protein